MSASERKLWQLLRHKGVGAKFRRQYPAGPYVLDFYCPQRKLCVELDGDAHTFLVGPDAKRDAWLAAHGVQTLRITTAELYENAEAVVELIRIRSTPPPVPSPFCSAKRGGEKRATPELD